MEFLSQKGNVIHGDISINNILINRVWDCSLEDSPARLRLLASNINASTNDPGPNDEHGQDADDREDNSMPMLGLPHDQANPPVLPPASATVSVNYDGTLEPIEAAGMLIDCDFMRYKDNKGHQTSVRVSGILS